MGNTNCNNAVPCLGSEGQGDSPKGLGRSATGKRGVIAKNNRNSSNVSKRNIDSLLMESRE